MGAGGAPIRGPAGRSARRERRGFPGLLFHHLLPSRAGSSARRIGRWRRDRNAAAAALRSRATPDTASVTSPGSPPIVPLKASPTGPDVLVILDQHRNNGPYRGGEYSGRRMGRPQLRAKGPPTREFYLGVSGKARELSARSCSAIDEEGNEPLVLGFSAVLAAQRRRSSKGGSVTIKPDLPIVPFASRASREAWLQEPPSSARLLRTILPLESYLDSRRTLGFLSAWGTLSPSFLPPGMCHSITWFISAPTSMIAAV